MSSANQDASAGDRTVAAARATRCALSEGYAVFGRRDDLTRQQGPVVPPAGLHVDDDALGGIPGRLSKLKIVYRIGDHGFADSPACARRSSVRSGREVHRVAQDAEPDLRGLVTVRGIRRSQGPGWKHRVPAGAFGFLPLAGAVVLAHLSRMLP